LGYIPIGFAYGVLAQKAGLSAFNTLAMSIFVYAGSSQLIAVGLFAAGAAPVSIILTTFVVNLRHMLMSSALAPYLSRWNKLELSVFAFEVTDESFALHSLEFPKSAPQGGPGAAESIALNMTAQISWILGGWLGLVTGSMIADIKLFALDYALPAMFIALLMMQIKDQVQVAVAIATGIIAVGLLLMGLDQWYVIIATLIGATLGMMVEEWIKTRSS
jgi:4-azaleucine resistance transporter AzlC